MLAVPTNIDLPQDASAFVNILPGMDGHQLLIALGSDWFRFDSDLNSLEQVERLPVISEGGCGTSAGFAEMRLAPGLGVPQPTSATSTPPNISDMVAYVLGSDGHWNSVANQLGRGDHQAEINLVICVGSSLLVLGVDASGSHPYLYRFRPGSGWQELQVPPKYLGVPQVASLDAGAVLASERAGTYVYMDEAMSWTSAMTNAADVGNLVVSNDGVFVGSRLVVSGVDPSEPSFESRPSAARIFR